MNLQEINPDFLNLEVDYLYHFGIDTSMDLAHIFADIKYVLFTRSNDDAAIVANAFAKKWYNIQEESFTFLPLFKTDRFHLYKIGPVLAVSHGIGMPSTLICLNEIIKLLVHINNLDVSFIRISPAGGLDLAPGTTVICKEAVNSSFKSQFRSICCGDPVYYDTYFDTTLTNDIFNFSKMNGYTYILLGKTIGAHDFFEEQARIDGALTPPYTILERNQYLKDAKAQGVLCMDMEMISYAGVCNKLQIKACAIHSVIIDRFNTDQVSLSKDEQATLLAKPVNLVIDYIFSKLGGKINHEH